MTQFMNDRQAWELATRNAVMQGAPIQTFDEWKQARQQPNAAQSTQRAWDEVTAMRSQRNNDGGAA